MRVSVSLEQRFYATPDRAVWTPSNFPYSFWERYLQVFDEVQVIARVLDVDRPQKAWNRVDGCCVSAAALPHYHGPYEYVLRQSAVRRELRMALRPEDAVILRAPSPIGCLAAKHLEQRRQPYGVEVLGDPYDVFAAGAVQHPLRPFFRWVAPRRLRRLVSRSAAAAYVTEHTLQRRYPAPENAFGTHYSSVELPLEAFASSPRSSKPKPHKRLRLVSVGSLEQMYKAPDITIEAVSRCIESGIDAELVWIGDGKHRREVAELAQGTRTPDRFHFRGNLPGSSAVRKELDLADLFIMASRTEGLPRAVIEAMARGLPCIGTAVGGIPELLPAECLVGPNDAGALARKIVDFCRDPKRMLAMSQRNLQRSQAYREEVLSNRRTEFYRHVREATERYLKECEQST